MILAVLTGVVYHGLARLTPDFGVPALYAALFLPFFMAIYAGYLQNVHDAQHWHAALLGIAFAIIYQLVDALLTTGTVLPLSLERFASNALLLAIASMAGSYVAHRHVTHGSRHFPKAKRTGHKPHKRRKPKR